MPGNNPSSNSNNVGAKTKKGVAWITLARSTSIVIQFGGSIALARLLMPVDFGINGIAAIFAGWALRMGNFGFNAALVQRKQITQDHISSAHLVHIGINTVLCGILVLLSPYIGRFFESPLAGTVTAVISISFIIHGFSGIPQSILHRQMRFREMASAQVISTVVAIAVSIVLAVLNYGVWSLVIGKLSGDIVRTIMVIFMSGCFPKWKYNHTAMKELFSFGIWLFWRNHLKYMANKADFFIIAKILGPAALGFYERAFNVIDLPQKKIISGIDGVLFSTFSRIQDETERVKAAYAKVVLSVSLFIYPVFAGLFMIAPAFVTVVYGEKWAAMIVPLQILCIVGILRSVDVLGNSVITARGQVRAQVTRQLIYLVALAVGCIFGSQWGITGVATMVVLANLLLVTMMIGLLRTINDITLMDFLKPQRAALTYSLIMVAGIKAFQEYASKVMGGVPLLQLIVTVVVGAVIYLTCMFVFKTRLTRPLIAELSQDIRAFFTQMTTRVRNHEAETEKYSVGESLPKI